MVCLSMYNDSKLVMVLMGPVSGCICICSVCVSVKNSYKPISEELLKDMVQILEQLQQILIFMMAILEN